MDTNPKSEQKDSAKPWEELLKNNWGFELEQRNI